MKTRHTFLAAAGFLLLACNEVTRPATTPEIAPSLDLAAAAEVAGWSGGDLAASEIDAQQAQHFRDFPCGVPTTNFFPIIVTTESHATVSNSGNAVLFCKAELPAGIPAPEGGAVQFRDFACGIPGAGGLATSSHAVITPSGKAILTCHFKSPS